MKNIFLVPLLAVLLIAVAPWPSNSQAVKPPSSTDLPTLLTATAHTVNFVVLTEFYTSITDNQRFSSLPFAYEQNAAVTCSVNCTNALARAATVAARLGVNLFYEVCSPCVT